MSPSLDIRSTLKRELVEHGLEKFDELRAISLRDGAV
jgi:hypothetical protein